MTYRLIRRENVEGGGLEVWRAGERIGVAEPTGDGGWVARGSARRELGTHSRRLDAVATVIAAAPRSRAPSGGEAGRRPPRRSA